jgi:integral membrane protein
MTDSVTKKKPSSIGIGSLNSALAVYRTMAFVTGVVLATGSVGLIYEHLQHPGEDASWLAFLWIAHGYLFMAYAMVTLNLAVHQRWHPLRAALTMAAGTVPTMSFVAERVVTRQVRSPR